ncbi:MAG: 16S rRNA pseudouridine(516) synthase [Rubrivivax sp.]
MQLSQILYSQGFGSRRECAALLSAGRVRVTGQADASAATNGALDFDPEGLVIEVDGRAWPVFDKAVLLMHKPAGFECSRKPHHHPSVMQRLPPPLQRRGVQPVGRLDADTTGLLLLTDDGALIHRLTSPRHHVRKVYEATTRHAIDDTLVRQLLDGVQLLDEDQPVRATDCRAIDTHLLELTLTEGKYHQVKRMVAAAGNRVDALHRSRFGALSLPADLPPGEWRWLDRAAVASISAVG